MIYPTHFINIRNIRELALPAILSMALFSAAFFFPPLGIIFSIFCPIPIIIAYLYSGQKIGMKCLLAATAILFIITNAQIAVIFFVEYGLVAVIMAESIRRNYSINKITLLCVGASILLGGSLLFLLAATKEINLSDIMVDQIKQSMDSSISLYSEMGLSLNDIDDIKLYSEKLALAFISLIPSLMIASSSVGVILNFVLVKIIWNKYVKNSNYLEEANLEKWSANEYFIWALIGSGLMLIIPLKGFRTIGLNILVISLLVYFYQGIAVVLYHMKKRAFPFFLKVIIYFLLIIQPLLLLVVTVLGVFDFWLDFRKLKTNT